MYQSNLIFLFIRLFFIYLQSDWMLERLRQMEKDVAAKNGVSAL